MTEPRMVGNRPTPGQKITELHCWVATYADGTEGIIAGGIEGLGIVTLMSSNRRAAEKMEGSAREAQQLSNNRTKHRVVSVRLVTFTTTEGTRQ
jgi:hypothetical protein